MAREIKPELLDELLSGVTSSEELLGDAGLFRQLKKNVAVFRHGAHCRPKRVVRLLRSSPVPNAGHVVGIIIPPDVRLAGSTCR